MRDVCAPVDLDGRVGVVIDVPSEVYKLVRLVAHLDGCLLYCIPGRLPPLLLHTASDIPFVRKHMLHDLIIGLRYGEAKRRAHDHDHTHHLPGLFGRLRDDSGVVSVKYAPQRRRQGWLSGGCPPPRTYMLTNPLFTLKSKMRNGGKATDTVLNCCTSTVRAIDRPENYDVFAFHHTFSTEKTKQKMNELFTNLT